jgi:CHASE2 domain-containing sensor protein/signal transduction histidine kinase
MASGTGWSASSITRWNGHLPDHAIARRTRAVGPPHSRRSLEDDRRRRLWIEWVATGLASMALLTTLLFSGSTVRLDNALYDTALRLQRGTPRSDIVVVAIDATSLNTEGEWPWPRRRQGELISKIGRDHPYAVAWYFLFATATDKVDDQALHDAMAHTPTYVGSMLQAPFGTPFGRASLLASSAAAGDGPGEVEADSDGIVRNAFLFEGLKDHLRPNLVLQLAHLVGHGPAHAPPMAHAAEASHTIYRAGTMLIPYVGPPGSFKEIPAASVLQGKVEPGYFRNKFVLVGATAPNLLDDYPTPVSTASGMPDVEVQANILNALLDGAAITPASRVATFLVSLALMWLVLAALVRLAPTGNLWLFAGMTGLPLLGAVAGITILRVWMPPASFVLTEAIIIPYWGWRRLNAASAYFNDEIRALERSVGGAVLASSRSAAGVGGDVVLQQMTLLQEAKTRVSDLRRFVADMLANFPDPVLVVDRGCRILTVNQAASDFAERMGLSATPGAPAGPILDRISLLDREQGPIWPPAERQTTAPSSAGLGALTGIAPGGRAYEVRFTATRSADDDLTGWIVHLADVTSLVSAMRQREEALQLLSHDMRAPQSAILATLSHPDFQGAPRSLRHRIEAHARRTLELADSFVRLAKAESASYTLEPIDLAHVLQDATEAVWPMAQAGRVEVSLERPQEEFVILADRSLLARALINLLDNAVKFSPPGERVVCKLRHTTLEGVAAVTCEIADHAGGMGVIAGGDIFKRFGVSRVSARGAPGIGLGLALVRTVVTRHAGEIVCDSVEGEGTVFTITLPLYEEALEAEVLETAL